MSPLRSHVLLFVLGVAIGFYLFSRLFSESANRGPGNVKTMPYPSSQSNESSPAITIPIKFLLGANTSASSNSSFSILKWATALVQSSRNLSLNDPSSSPLLSSTNATEHQPLRFDSQRQRAPQEKEWLRLHMCNEPFEAYSAAWLTTKEHLIAVNNSRYNLTWVMTLVEFSW